MKMTVILIAVAPGSILLAQTPKPSPGKAQSDFSGSPFEQPSFANAHFYAGDFGKSEFRSTDLAHAAFTSCNLSSVFPIPTSLARRSTACWSLTS
jgi:uncharacterized protein YjbI with pentapeptide repeats